LRPRLVLGDRDRDLFLWDDLGQRGAFGELEEDEQRPFDEGDADDLRERQ
jgi:hypothetical protein